MIHHPSCMFGVKSKPSNAYQVYYPLRLYATLVWPLPCTLISQQRRQKSTKQTQTKSVGYIRPTVAWRPRNRLSCQSWWTTCIDVYIRDGSACHSSQEQGGAHGRYMNNLRHATRWYIVYVHPYLTEHKEEEEQQQQQQERAVTWRREDNIYRCSPCLIYSLCIHRVTSEPATLVDTLIHFTSVTSQSIHRRSATDLSPFRRTDAGLQRPVFTGGNPFMY